MATVDFSAGVNFGMVAAFTVEWSATLSASATRIVYEPFPGVGGYAVALGGTGLKVDADLRPVLGQVTSIQIDTSSIPAVR